MEGVGTSIRSIRNLKVTDFEEAARLLDNLDATVLPGCEEGDISKAEGKLNLTFPKTFRQYLETWGGVFVKGNEFLGLDCVEFTLKSREFGGLPENLIVFRDENGHRYFCIANDPKHTHREMIVVWDVTDEARFDEVYMSFRDFFTEELQELLASRGE